MLKKHTQFVEGLLFAGDMVSTAAAWCLSYVLRFEYPVFPVTKGNPGFAAYAEILPIVLVLCAIAYRTGQLYVPRREGSILTELFSIVKANAIAFLLLVAFVTFYRAFEYSRGVLLLFLGVNAFVLIAFRSTVRLALRRARERGWNLKYALIVGSGKLGQRVARRIAENTWVGVRVVGYIDDRAHRQGQVIEGLQVLGTIADLDRIVAEKGIDQVWIALPFKQAAKVEEAVDRLAQTMVDVRIVPDLTTFATLNHGVTELDGLPIIHLRETPLVGWNKVMKRGVDILLSAIALLLLAIPLGIIALLVKLTSRGPVFYAQERMGLDGSTFRMLKFRTMRVDAEKETGAVWAKKDDPRRTPIGAFLRSTSLDELPQFWNVLKGDMSIVGPRPERPVFIEQFKKSIPGYMMRHKMKTGITGWAQVNGWRGNTSLKKRIQYDLYYIENWSLWFDLRIMLMTIFRIRENAY